jgi:DNA-binding response OmpR family regulator
MKVLIVEDDRTISAALCDGLRQEMFAVDVEYDGEDGYAAALGGSYDLLILDIMLPGMDGIELAQALRTQQIHIPILMLSAKDQAIDKVTALNIGADDYVTKPFSFEELLARVKALLRRPQTAIGQQLHSGTLVLDTITNIVTREGQEIKLSAKEYAVLEYLLRNKHQVISKHNLLNHVWDFDADVLAHTVEVTVANLRTKVDKQFNEPLIQTVRGFGYTIKG